MNTLKKTVAIILSVLTVLAVLSAAACKKQTPTPVVTGDPNASSSAANQNSGSSKDTEKNKYNTGTAEKKLWNTLGDKVVLTVCYNGKENKFTAADFDNLHHFVIEAYDPDATTSRNGDQVPFEGAVIQDILKSIGIAGNTPDQLILTTASGETIDLTAELPNISFKRCVFALSSNEELLPDDRLCYFIVVTTDGNASADYYGIVRMDLHFS